MKKLFALLIAAGCLISYNAIAEESGGKTFAKVDPVNAENITENETDMEMTPLDADYIKRMEIRAIEKAKEVLGENIYETEEEIQETTDSVKENIAEMQEDVVEGVESIVTEAEENVAETQDQVVEDVKEIISEVQEEVKDNIAETKDKVERTVEEVSAEIALPLESKTE
ncbi:MAG: hypothetical protein IJZ59_01680 [Alphaproteobacteria bacterium]|nr:hypothetical protein [Alphaproteobacteria bacterium]